MHPRWDGRLIRARPDSEGFRPLTSKSRRPDLCIVYGRTMVPSRVLRRFHKLGMWGVAPIWVGLALLLGLFSDHLAVRGVLSRMSSSSATAVLSAIASGMIAFTGFVFSMAFVGLQFGSSAYSPRLAHEIGRRTTLVGHAFGVFTGTFLYSLLAIRTIDISDRIGVNTSVIIVAFVWLLASVALFLRLMPGLRVLSVSGVLEFLERAGASAIAKTLRPTGRSPIPKRGELPPITQMIRHTGGPAHIRELDLDRLVSIAFDVDGVVMVPHAVGDAIMPGAPLALVLGTGQRASERRLRDAVVLGPDRVLDRDPGYALRLLVDVAIRALSPAINDPTTAVQVLDRISALLARIGHAHFEGGHVADRDGELRLIYSQPAWNDFLLLGLLEIQQYGSESVQVQRRLTALLRELEDSLPHERRPAVRDFRKRHEASLPPLFRADGWIPEGASPDPQGLGHTWLEWENATMREKPFSTL